MRQASPTIKRNKAEPLAQAVYGKLLDRILNGTWTPGTICDRRSVAKEFGVSIAPVGEAMIRLEEDGFIVNLPRKGTMLRACDPRHLYESLILREAVECQAARMSFGKLKASEGKLRDLAKAADADDFSARREADAAFHRELAGICGVAKLSEQLERMSMQMLFDELRLLDYPGKKADSHAEMLDSMLSAKSSEEAAERMRKHLRSGRESLIGRFEKPE